MLIFCCLFLFDKNGKQTKAGGVGEHGTLYLLQWVLGLQQRPVNFAVPQGHLTDWLDSATFPTSLLLHPSWRLAFRVLKVAALNLLEPLSVPSGSTLG
jgi:hypothetical protein